MQVKLIDVSYHGHNPGEEIRVTKAEGAYLIGSGNAVEVKPKQNKTHGGE